MNQLDSNRFNTFGNESDRNTICSTQRARKPPSIQKYSSEPTSQRETSAVTSSEAQNQKQEFITCHTESSGDSQVGHPDDFDLKENLMKGMVSPLEGQLLGTLDLKQFEMDKSMENTFKTALSKLTSGNATMKEDFKNTLSLMFPCDYFIPGSISNSVVYNKTILEVSESEREGGLERQGVSKALADLAKRHPFAKKKIEDQRDGDYQDALQHMKQCAMKDEVMSDQFTGPESHSTRRTKATEESELKSNRPSEKADLMNEFKGLKKEVTAIQKDLRVSDDYNKKLEEHIYQQSVQIMQVLKNFNMINEENGILKQQLAGALRKSTSKETGGLAKMQTGKYDQIDHAIARKAVKFLNEEISQLKTRHEKIIRNHENIIQDLQIQLRSRDTELEELKKHNREENEARALNDLFLFQPKRSFADNRKSDYELHSLREGHGQAVDIKRSGFYTPNRMRPLNELKPSDSHEKHYDVKTSKSTRNMGDITSSGSFNYHKQAKEFIKDLQRSKGRDKENIPRDSYTGGKTQDGKAPLGKSSSQLTPSHFQGELSSKGRERSGSTTKAHKEGKESYEKGLHFEQFNMREMKDKKREKEKGGNILQQMSQDGRDFESEDELKKSMVDISFEISYLKENIDKRLESELNSLNISPAKEKESKSRSSQRHQTKKPLHNNSQFNEISIINEQPSENFMTESVHTKLISELQSHPDSIKKQRPEEVEINYMKAPKEYSSSRTRGEEYLEKRNSHSSGLTPKEYPGYSHDMKAREHYSNSRRDTTSYVKENAEQYHPSQSKRSKKDVVAQQEEKSGEQYKRSKSSEKPIKAQAHILQQGSSHRLPSDASEERKPRKEETQLEKGYREYLKELADKSKKQPKSESHMHSNTHEKSSRHAQNRSKERSSHHDRHHPAEKQVSHHTHNDTIVNLNMALEKMLEKDVDKGNYKSNKHRSSRPDENDRFEVIPEQDDLQIEYRSKSSGHGGHRKKSATPSSHLQLQAPNQSSKTISSRAEGNELISRKNHDKDYDRMYNEGEYHLPTGPVTNKSSRRQFYGLKEDLNNFNSCEGDGFTGGQTSTHAGKPRLDPSRGGPTKSVTPTGAYNNKIQMYKGSNNDSASQSQTHLGRESKSSRRSHQNVQGEPVVRNMNSFEHGASSGTGRNSSVGHSKSGSGIAKGDKYAYNSTKYQMGPYNDISIVDYKYPDELIRNEEARAQHSTNDFVNFDSVLHHEREINGIYKSNNSSFVLFHNTNLDSINSSTVFEAFPTKKSSNQKDMSKAPAQGGYSTKFMKHL